MLVNCPGIIQDCSQQETLERMVARMAITLSSANSAREEKKSSSSWGYKSMKSHYRICSIRHHGYYLFHHAILWGYYSRAATIWEWCLLNKLRGIATARSRSQTPLLTLTRRRTKLFERTVSPLLSAIFKLKYLFCHELHGFVFVLTCYSNKSRG